MTYTAGATSQKVIEWLLQGDVSIQYQTHRDLLNTTKPELQNRIAQEGWGARFLSKRKSNGHWGQKFYQPKWISTHYTLLDLRNLCIHPEQPEIRTTLRMILEQEKSQSGCILPIGETAQCDVCVNGMFLNYASYFRSDEELLQSIIDFLIEERMPDGGYNCQRNRQGARHSSMHSTISVLEGLSSYMKNGYTYRLPELQVAHQTAIEFLLLHQLYLSDRTGQVIKKDFLRFPYPARWKYDILRGLDYFQWANISWDKRMQPAINVLIKKQNRDGTWNVNAKHPGQVHFEMEKAGRPSRWNTLRALRILKNYAAEITKS